MTSSPISTKVARIAGPAASPQAGIRPSWSAFDLWRALLPLLTWAAMTTFAWAQVDPIGGAEARFLALLSAGVLGAIAALTTPGQLARLGAGVAGACVAAVWLLHHGGHRGGMVVMILAGGLAYSAFGAWKRLGAQPAWTVPVALGLQLLTRSDLLLPPLLDARTLVSLLVLPLICAVGISLLAARFGSTSALLGGGVVVVLAPGFNVTVTLAIVSIAAAAWLGASPRSLPSRGLAVVAWLLPIAVLGRLGIVFVVTALLSLLAERRPRAAAALALILALASALATGAMSWSPQATLLVALPLVLLPAAVLAPARLRWMGLIGISSAVAGVLTAQHPEGASAGMLLLAVAATNPGKSFELQRYWWWAMAAPTVLLAAYPWAWETPLARWPATLGLTPMAWLGLAVLLVPALGCALTWLSDRLPDRLPCMPKAQAIFVTALALLWLLIAPHSSVMPLTSTEVLSADRPVWRSPLEDVVVSSLTVDSSLVHGSRLEVGTIVATVRLFDENDEERLRWRLRAGKDTAEWAARRPDVASLPGFVAPPALLHQLSPDGTFFGQRFRSHRELPETLNAVRMSIRRAPGLPPDVHVVLHRLDLRR